TVAPPKLSRVFRLDSSEMLWQRMTQEAREGASYRLEQTDLNRLANAGVSRSVLAKLHPLVDRRFNTEEAFLEALKQALTQDEINQYRNRLLGHAREGGTPLDLKYEIVTPVYPAVPKDTIIVRRWEPLAATEEPAYVCYGRLYFEQLNSERYGWSFGILH